ncbi:MAG: hypothetical protein WD042_14820 [Phycisphaeraceae bacterium]
MKWIDPGQEEIPAKLKDEHGRAWTSMTGLDGTIRLTENVMIGIDSTFTPPKTRRDMSNVMRFGMATMVVGAALLAGCGSKDRITAEGVRANMSPELQSVGDTAQQRKNRQARAVDTTLRAIHDDWDYFWLIDRPTNLSRYPIPRR